MACPEFATLNNGAKMPLLGYGTWQAKVKANEDELETALDQALAAGYRHIDTAFFYQNEGLIGKVLKRWLQPAGTLRREDVFIVTKLPMPGYRAGGPKEYADKSLAALQLDYVDLFLFHAPFWPEHVVDQVAVWREMEELVDAGRAKAIGLSNFNKRQIQHVLDHCRIRPANLQIELHVFMQQRPLVDFCHQNGITVTSFGPLGSPGTVAYYMERYGIVNERPSLLSLPDVVAVARKHGRSPAQVLLQHIVRRGVAAVPKSVSAERIVENLRVFDFALDEEDVRRLDALDRGKAGRMFNASTLGLKEDDPNYPYHEYP